MQPHIQGEGGPGTNSSLKEESYPGTEGVGFGCGLSVVGCWCQVKFEGGNSRFQICIETLPG